MAGMDVRDILPRDAIPSIDEPAFAAEHPGESDDEAIVFGDDPPRAYPIRVLNHHEIVNDVVDGRPVAVTWCPICASAVVYDRRVGGRTLTFGVSGKLADDALVLYDRKTGSEWKQSSGRCFAGEQAGAELEVVPVGRAAVGAFLRTHPEGVVLQPPEGAGEAYPTEPYERYDEAEGFGVGVMRGTGPGRSWDRTDIGAKTTVLGVEWGDDAVGYPLPAIERAGGVLTDTVGGRAVVVFTTGSGLAGYENPGYEFTPTDDGSGFEADGTVWNATTGAAADGRRLDRLPTRRLYAFAWQDDHGPDAFYSP